MQIIPYWNCSPTPPLSFLLLEACRKQQLINCVTLGPSFLATFFYHLLQHLFLHSEACTEPKLSPAGALMLSKSIVYKDKFTEVKDETQIFFHKVRSSAMFSAVSCMVSGSCRPAGPGLQMIIPTSSPRSQEPAFSCLSYSHLLCSTAEHRRYYLPGFSFILCHKINWKASCVSSVRVDLFFLVWFLLSSTLTVLDLGSFQSRGSGLKSGSLFTACWVKHCNIIIVLHFYSMPTMHRCPLKSSILFIASLNMGTFPTQGI